MKPNSPAKDALEERSDLRYMEPNRDRVLGEEDRSGRHFDETVEAPDEAPEAPNPDETE